MKNIVNKNWGWAVYVFLSILTFIAIGCVRGFKSNGADHEIKDPGLTGIIDLASDSAWQIRIDDGPWRSIKVPGGGYNSDLQEEPLIDKDEVIHSATYRRSFKVPENAKGKVILLAFGAVNHGCEIFIDDRLIQEHVGPLMPFRVDITDHVDPGGTYDLKVVSHPQWFYDYNVPHGFIYTEARNHPDSKYRNSPQTGWASKFAYGITRGVELQVKPEIYIRDVFVRPSVRHKSLTFDVWIHNHTGQEEDLVLAAGFSACGGEEWDYPRMDPENVHIEAGGVEKVTMGPFQWDLGPESYWWPNKPFAEDYRAMLHKLDLRLKNKGVLLDDATERFGFVEWLEEEHYYTVNGVRINMVSDGTPESAMSEYDCYAVSSAFLPPTDSTSGCPETWKRYMRLGICANRIHQSTPTEYMMDVADELGFILVAETPIRGCQKQIWEDMDPYLNSVKDMALYGRNHPSICRYSLLNEGLTDYIPELVDAIRTIDATRPLVFEDNRIDVPVKIKGTEGHAYAMLHYVEYPRPAEIITGMGEFAWSRISQLSLPPSAVGGLEEFIYYGGDMRRWDIVYFAGWDFINYWPNFLEGMNHDKHAWKQSIYHKDREDGNDGWDSPVVALMKKYFHPFLVMDLGIHENNGPDSDASLWPENPPSYRAGDRIERKLLLFNDGLSGDSFRLKWEARWDSEDGELVDEGMIEEIIIDNGFHKEITLQITVPGMETGERNLFIVLSNELEKEEVFRESNIYFIITGNDRG